MAGTTTPRPAWQPRSTDYLAAALPAVPGLARLPGLRRAGDQLPSTVEQVPDVHVDREHLARYTRLCGFDLSDHLPATYPHVLGFGAQLRLVTSRSFPFPAVGLVHIANSIAVHRPLFASVPLSLTVQARDLRPHPRGRQLSLVTTGTVDGEPVWEETSTYLRRGPGADPDARRPGPEPSDLTTGTVTWRLPADLGRRYAEVSGDLNPIHLNPLFARAFGFPRAIAHGMWTAARALAAVQHRLPDTYRYDVAFAAPILLPSTVTLAVRAGDAPGHADLAVIGSKGRHHLTGVLEELQEPAHAALVR
ncbi:MAG: MaoC family dehydratase [Actinomycetes bacterium]